jgi:acetyl-CoA carboxylase carboxyltransferase component
MVIAYDDGVWAGSQSGRNHIKFDRAVRVADEQSLPVVFFGEGVGGRSGDTDGAGAGYGSGAQTLTYEVWPRLSGKVPLIGITGGWCFAGNASILGCCDVIIATNDAMIGMGGPAVIAGGGLGNFLPEEIGPMTDQVPNGVVDILVDNEEAAVAAAKQYLSYFQGRVDDWSCVDQRELRHVIPENRLRAYDVRRVIELLADTGSVLELRPRFGIGVITALVRIEGRPVGVIANNNAHLGGAVDSPASDKLCRFAQICDAFNIPILSLLDTPGMMVGPEVERTALVRHCNNIFVTLANARCPRMAIVLRKAYGLAAQAMTMGCTRTPTFTLSWPTGEFGGMNLEASVLLGHRHRLAEIGDLDERAAAYEALVTDAYARGSALNVASTFEIDGVIDPADTRARIVGALDAVPDEEAEPLRRGRSTYISTW